MSWQKNAVCFAVALGCFILSAGVLGDRKIGMPIVAYFLTRLLLEQSSLGWKVVLDGLVGLLLLIIGHYLSLQIALAYVAPLGAKAWTFAGGFLGGIIELEVYFLLALFPMKYWLSRDLRGSFIYCLKTSALFFPIAGVVQGTYIIGWHNISI